jgi:hypothetical protein
MNDDFGTEDQPSGSDRSLTAEDAALHGQPSEQLPAEEQVSPGETASGDDDPDLFPQTTTD